MDLTARQKNITNTLRDFYFCRVKCNWFIGMVVLTALFAQIFSRFAVIANYHINTQTFAEHCENKQKPDLHCNGKCQMMKKLNQEEKKEQQTPERKIEETLTLYCETFFAHFPVFFIEEPTTWGMHCEKNKMALFSRSLLRPPATLFV